MNRLTTCGSALLVLIGIASGAIAEGGHTTPNSTASICSKDFDYEFTGPVDFSAKGYAAVTIKQQIVGHNAVLSATWAPTPANPSPATKAFIGAIKGITVYYEVGGTSELSLFVFPATATMASYDAKGAKVHIHEMYARFDGKCE
jgi:hypothetical protein